LESIRKEINLDDGLYREIKIALKNEYNFKRDEHADFLKCLDSKLKRDLSYRMNQKVLSKISFFHKKEKRFIGYIALLLKPMEVPDGRKIYGEGAPADCIYFLKKGTASLSIKTQNGKVPYMDFTEGKLTEELFS
jgi:hypothetical protein